MTSIAQTVKSHNHRPETLKKHEAILQAAVEVFGQKGSNAGTLEEVAQKVGMTRAGVLHHFGSKNQLLLETLIYRDEIELDEYSEHKMPIGADTFRHLIKTAQLSARRPGIVAAFVTQSAESITEGNLGRDYFATRYGNLRRDIINGFKDVARVRHQAVDDNAVFNAAASIIAAMDGLQLQWLLEPDIDLAESTQYAIHAIVNSVFIHAGDVLDDSQM